MLGRLLLGLLTSLALAAPVAAQPNPYQLVVHPASGAGANTPIQLEARLQPGQSAPAGIHCLFQAVPQTGNTISSTSPQCAPVTMQLAAGTWTLRLVVHRATGRGAPTLRETLGTPEVRNYQVGTALGGPATGSGGAPISCPSQCEVRANTCVKPAGDVMPCLAGGKCPGGYTCTGGFCRQTPSTSGPVLACATNSNCPPGWSCRTGQCRAPTPSEPIFACNATADCSQGWVCAAGQCRRTCP